MNDNNEDTMPHHPSLTTRLKVIWEQTPMITKSILATCSAIYLAALFVGWDNIGAVCLSATTVISHLQLWRLITSATFHAGLLHLAFNMMAFFPMGTSLERSLGSFNLLWLIGILIFLGDGLYIAVSYLASLVGFPILLSHCAVGFSGVIFGLIPLDVRASGGAQRSIFGLFTVPALAYPWVLLVLWQLLVPQSSFLGHLSGLAIGQLYSMGLLKLITPSNDTVQNWERSLVLSRCVAIDSYIANTGSSVSGGLDSGSYSGYGGVSESLLPTFGPQGGSSGAGSSNNNSASNGSSLFSSLRELFKGPWMAYPTALNPQHTSNTSNSVLPSSGSSNSQQQQPPIGAMLGGMPAQLDAKAAAAAAAEARMKSIGNSNNQPSSK
jgi:membrane associated rhomboid family serine protease